MFYARRFFLVLALLTTSCAAVEKNDFSPPRSRTVAQKRPLTNEKFFNVLVQDGADPSVYRHTDGFYYSTYTTGDSVRLWKHRSLTGMDAGESKTLWSGCCNVWAPEVQFINGSWNIYFAKSGDERLNHRMFVLHNKGADPFEGEWTFSRIQDDSDDQWAIDGVAFEQRGQLYFVWSGWENNEIPHQNLYIAPMDSPTHISGPRVKIARPQFAWETNTEPLVNEGPEVIVRDGRINIVYSGSGSWTDGYALGLVTAPVTNNLLSASSWTKQPNQVFKSGNHLFGPGHHCFTKSPDGKEDWIVYHTARWRGSGWTREIRAQPFGWTKQNTPDFGEPVPADIPIHLPSGEKPRVRYEAEDAVVSGAVEITASGSASGGFKIGKLDNARDRIVFKVTAHGAGSHLVSVRASNGTRATAVLGMTVNSQPLSRVPIVNGQWDKWTSVTVRIELKSGVNEIAFTPFENFAELDAIDLFRE